MSVTTFQDLPLADRDREWDGAAAAEKRVRKWAGAEDSPNQKHRDAHVWYDGGARGGIDVPHSDVDRIKSHLAKYYKKIDETAPWDRALIRPRP